MDFVGHCDPYVQVVVCDANGSEAIAQTSPLENVANPNYNETFEFAEARETRTTGVIPSSLCQRLPQSLMHISLPPYSLNNVLTSTETVDAALLEFQNALPDSSGSLTVETKYVKIPANRQHGILFRAGEKSTFVREVLVGSAAAQGGMQPGCYIVSVGNCSVTTEGQFMDKVSRAAPGAILAIGVTMVRDCSDAQSQSGSGVRMMTGYMGRMMTGSPTRSAAHRRLAKTWR